MLSLIQTLRPLRHIPPQGPIPAQGSPQPALGIQRHETQQVTPMQSAVHGGEIQPGEILHLPTPGNTAANLGAMQVNDTINEFNGAFLSWENTWHAWGNSQTYSLLRCYELVKDEAYLDAARKELDNFYNNLIQNNYLNSFSVEKKDEQFVTLKKEKYSQIAYNIRPMVFALLEAYRITGEEKYAEQAANAALWFMGNNPAKAIMYDKVSGRIYDGINAEDDVNKNSGAESTIEGLLTIIKIKSTRAALKYFLKDE
jgi:uncharacterized protein YyaL (SSP411 family)